MKRRSRAFLLLLCCFATALGQQPQKPQSKAERDEKQQRETIKVDTIPLFNGIFVNVDLYGVASNLLGSDFISGEFGVGVNLKNTFIPVIEFGMGGTDTWSETGIHYKTKTTPYFRIGVDYNTMAKKKEKNSFLFAGARYGYTSFKYDIYNMPVTDNIWGDAIGNLNLEDEYWGGSLEYDYRGMKCSLHWVEVLLGVQIKMYKRFYMGWSIRVKWKMSASHDENGNPWYVPGYGQYKARNVGLTYSLIYKLPF